MVIQFTKAACGQVNRTWFRTQSMWPILLKTVPPEALSVESFRTDSTGCKATEIITNGPTQSAQNAKFGGTLTTVCPLATVGETVGVLTAQCLRGGGLDNDEPGDVFVHL